MASICHVCGRKLGGKSFNEKDTCIVVRDPIGNEKRVHHLCEKDSDGVRVRVEKVHGEPRFYDQVQFRVWPDGTVQCVDDGHAHRHMSDDFQLIWAYSEEEALEKSHGHS